MKIECSICNCEITDISISKTLEVRDDYEKQVSSGDFIQGPHDREYFSSKVNAIYYKCNCGEQILRLHEDNRIENFIRDSKRIDPNDLVYNHYGNLKIDSKEKSELFIITREQLDLLKEAPENIRDEEVESILKKNKRA